MLQNVKQLTDTGLRFYNSSLKIIIFLERVQFAFSIFHAAPPGRYHWIGGSRLRSALLSMALFLFKESSVS